MCKCLRIAALSRNILLQPYQQQFVYNNKNKAVFLHKDSYVMGASNCSLGVFVLWPFGFALGISSVKESLYQCLINTGKCGGWA